MSHAPLKSRISVVTTGRPLVMGASDERQVDIAAVVLGIAVTFPMLGNSFSIAGLDPRLIGLLLALGVGIREAVRFGRKSVISGGQLGVLAFFLLVFSAANGEQFAELAAFSNRGGESGYPLLPLLLVGPVLYSLLGVIFSHRLSSDCGHRSLFFGIAIVAWLAVGVAAQDWTVLTGGFSELHEFRKEAERYSAIYFSTAFLLGFIFSWYLVSKKTMRLVALSVFSVGVLLMLQRAHAAFLLLPAGFDFWRSRARLNNVGSGVLLLGLLVAGIGLIGAFENTLEYFLRLERGVDVRAEQYAFAWKGILERPFGSGFGHFSTQHYFRYPHNIWIEAFYEEGLFAGVLLVALTALGLRAVLSRTRPIGPGESATRVAFVAMLLHASKAGSVPSSDLLFFFLVICLRRPTTGSRAEGAIPESQIT